MPVDGIEYAVARIEYIQVFDRSRPGMRTANAHPQLQCNAITKLLRRGIMLPCYYCAQLRCRAVIYFACL